MRRTESVTRFPTWWWWSWFCQQPPGSSPGSGSQRCKASWRVYQGEGPQWWLSPDCSWSSCKALGRDTWCPMPPHTSCWTDLGPVLVACWPSQSWIAWTPSTLKTGDNILEYYLFKYLFQQYIFLESGEGFQLRSLSIQSVININTQSQLLFKQSTAANLGV